MGSSRGKALHLVALLAVLAAGFVHVDPVDSAGGSSFVAQRATKSTRDAKRPAIKAWLIPFGPKRKREMAAYSKRHYGRHQWRLRHPRVIVEHMAQAPTAAAVRAAFVPDRPDPELGELPNVCTHFVISRRGRIFQLGNRRALRASLRLTRWLRCHFGITIRNVIGHAEGLSSPYHHERVASLRNQTHGDWRHSSMRTYRRKLRHLGRC